MVEDRATIVERAADAGAAVAHDGFRTGIAVETKGDKTDVVTEADRAAQRRVIEVIHDAYPGDPIVGEEEDEDKRVPPTGPAWVIDPIDGTNNYVRDVPIWTTAVAAVVDGETVAAANVLPALGDRYVTDGESTTFNGDQTTVSDRTDPETFRVTPMIWWGRDRRQEYAAACREIVQRFGDLVRPVCAQYVLSMVAAGQLDGAITNVVPNAWDTVGGVAMVRNAGGVVTDLAGDPWTPGATGLVASNGHAHEELQAAVRAVTE
ncbi:MAG: inositol monophosphatase [Halobacteriaceae archaeon]